MASFETEVLTTASIANSGTHEYVVNDCGQQRHQSQVQGGIPTATFSRYRLAEWGQQATPTNFSARKVSPQAYSPISPSNPWPLQDPWKRQSQGFFKKGRQIWTQRESGGGKGGKGRGGSNGPPPPDGWRFPPLGDIRPPKTFGCPFYISDPLQFHECSSLRLRRSSDVSQHLMRSHLLRTMRLVRRRDTETTVRAESEESMQQDGTCANANGIRLYHQKCRMEFNGPNAEENLQEHCNNTVCYKAGIEQTGVMLPAEFRALIAARDSVTGGVAKWYAMWAVCFPPLVTTRFRTVPASPYVETTVPRELGEYTIRQALSNGLMGDHSLITDQIINQIYLGDAQTDLEVQQTVQDQQQERNLKLQQADYEAFYRQASPQQAMDWTWDNLPPGQYGGPQ
ncbi:hypothetical protein J7337_010413 [Fusarium musae]|uniref:Uncharacterized protein n=1 Tax=Fusarium musae TaxID=1042133 RepID=A0A9P8D8Z1_9HYPO|nr:hypothetical protein J7337_010413 [Fusarium musae]KAG9497552.1 hypothetical protein J7337_010413 [Fusarium musae]